MPNLYPDLLCIQSTKLVSVPCSKGEVQHLNPAWLHGIKSLAKPWTPLARDPEPALPTWDSPNSSSVTGKKKKCCQNQWGSEIHATASDRALKSPVWHCSTSVSTPSLSPQARCWLAEHILHQEPGLRSYSWKRLFLALSLAYKYSLIAWSWEITLDYKSPHPPINLGFFF